MKEKMKIGLSLAAYYYEFLFVNESNHVKCKRDALWL